MAVFDQMTDFGSIADGDFLDFGLEESGCITALFDVTLVEVVHVVGRDTAGMGNFFEREVSFFDKLESFPVFRL